MAELVDAGDLKFPGQPYGFESHCGHQQESNMKRILEIRPAEGGTDSKLFAVDLLAAYRRMCAKAG